MAFYAVSIFFLVYGHWVLPVGGQGQGWTGRQKFLSGQTGAFASQHRPSWFQTPSGDDSWNPQGPKHSKNYNPPKKQTPEKRRHEGTEVSKRLNQEIRNAWVPGAARILMRSADVEALAIGLTFPENERSEFLRKTEDRRRDGDVVTLKAIAKASLSGQNQRRLAKVMIGATSQPGYDQWLEKNDIWDLEEKLTGILSDKKLMFKIIAADPAKDLLPPGGRKRKLTCDACTPANSWVCAHCWPSTACKPFFWC
ncbi:hypothetical protein BSKO_05941 [Bryopsis sp. KO-2023]|nr:hypothetical protein BSKO_05941 [Bryopsis sp. KO-2023]